MRSFQSLIISNESNPESEFMERMEFSATETQVPRPTKTTNKNKQRFNDEQIRLLESMFESDTKLEPRKKEAVAGELGLHPRQVAIWFQNRRARGKSKQIEQELRILQANYDSLASQFEILKEEKKALLAQLQKLNSMVDNPPCGGSSTNRDQPDSRARHSSVQEELEETEMDRRQDFQKSGIIKWMEDEGCEVEAINTVEHEERQRVNSSLSFDNWCCSSEWLHFWT